MTPLYIFLGGGLGALTRWLLSASIQNLAEKTPLHRFPLGILTCNLLGCFLIGLLFGHFAQKTAPAWLFPLLATGFLGGFTTFSTFARDSHELFSQNLTFFGLLNLALSVLLGLLAVWAGLKITAS